VTHRPATTAIVLAGGRSSRFGGPKLAAELDGATILEHTLRAVEAVVGEIVVAAGAASQPESIAARPLRVVADDEPFAGPLAALEGALRVVTSELAIVVGGDMPGLVPAVLDAMVHRLTTNAEVDAVVLQDATHRQVLPLAIRVGPAGVAATDAMAAGDRSLARFLARLRSAELPAAEWRALDPSGRTLDDVDEPGDLDRLRNTQIH
jgi:molybdopterin-guanine dinucleotide biosynthesis protein A